MSKRLHTTRKARSSEFLEKATGMAQYVTPNKMQARNFAYQFQQCFE